MKKIGKRATLFYDMATRFDTSSCTYLYNQPCGLWNGECCHGCGYIHLSSASSSTKKKCCANGALSSISCNFDEELMMRFALDEMPLFMIVVTTTCKFCQDCTKYNNLLAMAATKVCNYCDNPGFTKQDRRSLCEAEWTNSSFLYKGIQFQPVKLWIIIFCF
jgi:hypothetical protein